MVSTFSSSSQKANKGISQNVKVVVQVEMNECDRTTLGYLLILKSVSVHICITHTLTALRTTGRPCTPMMLPHRCFGLTGCPLMMVHRPWSMTCTFIILTGLSFTGDVLTCHQIKGSCVNNKINDSWNLLCAFGFHGAGSLPHCHWAVVEVLSNTWARLRTTSQHVGCGKACLHSDFGDMT